MTLSSNTRLGRYKIRSPLGAGGMGEVYLAQDTELERTVALKVLPSDMAADQLRINRFIQEAKAVSALNHQNILTIHEIGQATDGTLFIATEFIDGVTLRQRMQSTRMSAAELLDVAIQIASALFAAHQAGIVHRDIKPENVMVRRDGHVKVLDFGLVKLIKQQSAAVDTQAPTKALLRTTPGTVIGTVIYMSPEQARGLPIDARTDIWSLGVVLYEMTTRRVPFDGKTNTDVIVSVLEREPPHVTHYAPEAPAELLRIILKALRKDREERYQTVKELLLDLQNLRQELEFAAKMEHSASPATEKQPTEAISEQPIVATGMGPSKVLAAATLLISLIIVAGYYFWNKRTDPTTPSARLSPSQQRLVSTFPGSHTKASFSPDGNRIAFVNEVNGIPQVWLKNLAGGDPVQITFDEDPAGRPRWSPAGNEIVYVRHPPGKVSIYSVSPAGGEPRKIIEGGRNPNWSWDGAKLVFERGYDVWVANRDGSDQRRIDNTPPTDFLAADRMPAFSPDGSLIAIFQNDQGPVGDYWVIPVPGGEARRITFDHIFGGAPVWTPDGQSIIFPSQRAGSMTLWRAPVAEGPPEAVLVSSGEDTEPEISRDGRKLIYTNTRSSHTLMLTDAGTQQSRELRESRVEMVDPSFSPDGSRIVFFGDNEEGEIHIFTIGADGKNLAQVTRGKKERNIHPQWSADGATIYFYQFNPTISFRKISVHGGDSTELVQGWAWGTHNGARVDPEGKRIIYSKMDKGVPVATMIRDIASGAETAFSLPLRQMRWSHDGRFVIGTDIQGRNWQLAEITVCAVDGETCRKVTKGYTPNWSHDDARIYFFSFTDVEGESLWVVSRQGSDERKIMDLRPMHPLGNFFDVSRQGQIAWVQYKEGKHELWLVDLAGR